MRQSYAFLSLSLSFPLPPSFPPSLPPQSSVTLGESLAHLAEGDEDLAAEFNAHAKLQVSGRLFLRLPCQPPCHIAGFLPTSRA
jgi:hypothetical protein